MYFIWDLKFPMLTYIADAYVTYHKYGIAGAVISAGFVC